jgi:polygalacturonase
LRYPFWHDNGLVIRNSEITELCRAALWYSEGIEIYGSRLHVIKALRECKNVKMQGYDIIFPEFGWSVHGLDMEDCTARSEYFMIRSNRLSFRNVQMTGKYSKANRKIQGD